MNGMFTDLRDALSGTFRCAWTECRAVVDPDAPGAITQGGVAACNREHFVSAQAEAEA